MSLVSSPRILPRFLCIIAASFFLTSIRTNAQVTLLEGTFKFYLVEVAKFTKGGRSQIIPLSDNMVLQAASLIKFYLELEREGYLYLFHEDSRSELARLFPLNSQPASCQIYTWKIKSL